MALAPPPVSLFTEDTGPGAPDMSGLLEEEPRRPVPHHLLESKLYTTLGRTSCIQAEPPALHFGGYEIGKCQRRILKLVNVSCDVSSVHVIPPQSRHFSISYRKANRLVPGLALTVDVHFIPNEWRQYCDIIRVHCQGDETLVVPLRGYPAPALAAPPADITLHAPSLGRSTRHVLRLRCRCPLRSPFHIASTQHHPDFHITPTSGLLPGNGVINITVTFTPSAYGSARMCLELLTSDFNAKPHRCTFTGVCLPRAGNVEESGISSNKTLKGAEKASPRVSRKKRLLKTLQHHASQVEKLPDRPHAVASILKQQLEDGRAGKETTFLRLLQQNIANEEANQLRWQVRLGRDAISPSQRRRIAEERQSQVRRPAHTDHRGESLSLLPGRVMREAGQQPDFLPLLHLHLWANRKRALRRFQQAARQVVILCRAAERLRKVRRGPREGDRPIPPLSTNHILRHDFPPFPAEPANPAAGDPRPVTPHPPAPQLRAQLPFCQLKVPQQYRVMGYQPLSCYEAWSTYLPAQPARPLRRGAEDELVPTAVTPPEAPPSAVTPPEAPPSVVTPPEAPPSAVTPPEAPPSTFAPQTTVSSLAEAEEKSLVSGILTVTPPQRLLRPPDLHPAHVYNPAPGLLAFKRCVPYAETDPDYLLCPLARRQEEMVPGVTSWRKFPAGTLSVAPPATHSSSTPRWCDPFNADLLPSDAPATLSDLPAADKENLAARDGARLTPQTLRAEFPLIQHGAYRDKARRDGSGGRQDGSGGRQDGSGGRQEEEDEDDSLAVRVRRRLAQMKGMSHSDWLILD